MKRALSKFNQKKIILYFSVDWEDILKVDEINIGNSTQMYLAKINILLDADTLLRRTDMYKLRFKSKPWITLGLYISKNQITY